MLTTRNTDCPAISLADAIKKIQMIQSKAQNYPVDKSSIASALGYNRMHGTYYTVITAFIQYGLMEPAGNQLKVSAEALKILQSSEEGVEERMKAIKKTATAPPLFNELYSLNGETLPNDDELKEFFTRKGLSQSKIGDAVRAYRDTMRYVNEQAKGSRETLNSEQSQTLKHANTGNPDKSGLLSSSFLDEKGEIELSFRDSGDYEVQIKYHGLISKILQDLIEFAQFQSLSSSFLDEKGKIELSFRDSGDYEVQIKYHGLISKILQDLIEFAQFQKKKYPMREGIEFGIA